MFKVIFFLKTIVLLFFFSIIVHLTGVHLTLKPSIYILCTYIYIDYLFLSIELFHGPIKSHNLFSISLNKRLGIRLSILVLY